VGERVTRHIRYTGPPAYARMLMQMLSEEGVEVQTEVRAMESRGAVQVAETIVVGLVTTGVYDSIKLAVTKFRDRAPRGRVELEGENDDVE
jgi:hypothetical protein